MDPEIGTGLQAAHVAPSTAALPERLALTAILKHPQQLQLVTTLPPDISGLPPAPSLIFTDKRLFRR
jgi:hypothetical protein